MQQRHGMWTVTDSTEFRLEANDLELGNQGASDFMVNWPWISSASTSESNKAYLSLKGAVFCLAML